MQKNKLIPTLTGFTEADGRKRSTCWFLMYGGSGLAEVLLRDPTIELQKKGRDYRMFVMKPAHVKGHFHEVVFNGMFHVLIQMCPAELPAITHSLCLYFGFPEDLQPTYISEPIKVSKICPSFLHYNAATRQTSAFFEEYCNEEASEDWSLPPDTLEESLHRNLEVYTNGSCCNILMHYN